MKTRRTLLRYLGTGACLSIAGCLAQSPDCSIDRRTTTSTATAGGLVSNYQSNAEHSGYFPGNVAENTGTEQWHVATGDSPADMLSVVIRNGSVFIAGEVLYALDQTDGSLNWCQVPGTRTPTGPAVAGDVVVVVSTRKINRNDDEGGLQAFDVNDGSRRWQNTAVGPSSYAPTTHDGTVYVSGYRGNPYVSTVDASTGEVDWRSNVGTGDVQSPAVTDDGVFIHTESALLKLDPVDGSERWHVSTIDPSNPPTVADGVVYARRRPATFAAWDAATGECRWEFDGFTAEQGAASTCVAGDTVFVTFGAGGDGRLAALRQSDGTPRWQRTVDDLVGELPDVNGPSFSQPVVTDDTIYVGFGDGLLAVTRDDGAVRWYRQFRIRTQGDMVFSGVPGPVAIANDTLFAYTGSGDVYAIQR